MKIPPISLLFLLAVNTFYAYGQTPTPSNLSGKFIEWALPIGAQTAAPNTVGSSEPLHVLPSFDDQASLFFTQRLLGYIGRLDAKSQITEWFLGPISFPHDLLFVGGTIILSEEGTNVLGQFTPWKNSIKEWLVPGVNPVPWHLARVNSYIYFSEENTQKIGRLNLVNNQITEWNTPTPNPEGLEAAGAKVWFVEPNFANTSAGKIAMLDTLKNTITEYPVSGAEAPQGLSHVKIFGRKVFFTDQGVSVNYLGEVDPSTNTVSEWVVPTANAATGDLDVLETECNGEEGALIEFSEFQGGKVASLNTSLQAPDSSVVVTPIVTSETPVVTTVVPVTRSLTPVVTKVAPVITPVTGVATGGFIEYAVPTPQSGPGGVAVFGDDVLIFTERSGDKVGILLH